LTKSLPPRHLFVLALILTALVVASNSHALPEPEFELRQGTEFPVDYQSYGKFTGIGTNEYKYKILDKKGLASAVGEGIYPNTTLRSNTHFKKFTRKHPKNLDPWEYVNGSAERNFYAWHAGTGLAPGTSIFYQAESLRRAGLIREALKSYYTIVIHFPRNVVWAYDQSFYWYAAPEAISRIRKLCALHPELGMTLEAAMVEVERHGHLDPEQDVVRVWPGQWVEKKLKKQDLSKLRIVQEKGGRKVKAVQFENGHWQLRVNGKPFILKGVTYTSTTVGESAHALNLRPWMLLDDNQNGRHDGMFDSWVDVNRNNRQDADEPVIGDAQLLKDMGANAIRYYHARNVPSGYDPTEYDKELMRELHRDYGIYFIMGDFLGAYTIGSGARWEVGTDYTKDPQRERMKAAVRAMVMDHKDEPYVLMWLLGNENQQPNTHTNAANHPIIYTKFVNEVAEMIKSLDPDHPVAIGNLATEGLMETARNAPAIDIYGSNVYAGAYSVGSVVQQVKYYFDGPLMLTEWGSDAYADGQGEDEDAQAEYARGNWLDMELNFAGNTGEGNVIGGIAFEWMDEWWKTSKGDSWGDPQHHNTRADFRAPFEDSWMHEEWLGIMGQGNGRNSHFMREVRKVYYALQELWREPEPSVVSKEGTKQYISYEGTIEYIDYASGSLFLYGTRDGAGKEIFIRLIADPEEVYVTDTMSNPLEFKDLMRNDFVAVDCIVQGDVLTVDLIFLYSVRKIE